MITLITLWSGLKIRMKEVDYIDFSDFVWIHSHYVNVFDNQDYMNSQWGTKALDALDRNGPNSIKSIEFIKETTNEPK